jgi:hypothetical protein
MCRPRGDLCEARPAKARDKEKDGNGRN